MNFELILLTGQRYVITSDETIKKDDRIIFGNISLKEGWNWGFKQIQDDKEAENENWMSGNITKPEGVTSSVIFKKIVAGETTSVNVNFNNFEGRFGLDDIDRLSVEYAENENSCYTNDYYGFFNGYKTALLRNDDKKFTLDQVIEFTERCMKVANETNGIGRLRKFIEEQSRSLTTPKRFKVELEMETVEEKVYDNLGGHPGGHWEDKLKPKITDHKVKIVNVL